MKVAASPGFASGPPVSETGALLIMQCLLPFAGALRRSRWLVCYGANACFTSLAVVEPPRVGCPARVSFIIAAQVWGCRTESLLDKRGVFPFLARPGDRAARCRPAPTAQHD